MPLWSMIKVYLVKIILVNTHLSLVSRVHVKINDPGKNINFLRAVVKLCLLKSQTKPRSQSRSISRLYATPCISQPFVHNIKKWLYCYDRLCSLHVPRGKHEMHKSHSKKANDQTSHNISIKRTHKIH